MKVDEEEISLALKLKEGRDEAFCNIYHNFNKVVSYFIGQYIFDKEAVKDLTHDVFHYIWEYRGRIDSQLGYKSYLLVIARTKALNYLRRNQYSKDFGDTVNLLYTENRMGGGKYDEEFFERLYNKDLLKMVSKEISRLSEPQKQVMIMSRMEHKSNREIAKYLNISVKTVEYRITAALKRLRRCIGYV